MLSRAQKSHVIKDLVAAFKTAKASVFCDFSGLAAKDAQSLRQALAKAGVSHKVVKLTLIKKALRLAGLDVSKFNYTVPLSVSLSLEDETAAAKILQDFAKQHDQLKIVCGILDHKMIGASEVQVLAMLPGKEQLLAQLVGVIAAPLRDLSSVLVANIRGLINVLNAKSKV